MQFLTARASHVGQIARSWWAMIYGLVWSALCSVDVLVGHYGTDSFKTAYNSAWIAPKWGWKVWIIGLLVITVLVIVEGSFRDAREREAGHAIANESRDKEIERLSHLSDCPTVRIAAWGEFGTNARGFSNSGFLLYNDGKTAYQVTMKEFTVGSRVAKARELAAVIGDNQGNGQMLVWLDGTPPLGEAKWNLLAAFKNASQDRDSPYYKGIYGVPNYVVNVALTYRDQRNLWYRTSQDAVYVPAMQDFEFGPPSYSYFGLVQPPT